MRKLLLIALAASATMMFAASTANASLSVYAEPGGSPCPQVNSEGHQVTGGCVIHLVTGGATPLVLRQHTPTGEVVFTACDNEFTAAIQKSGHGFIYNQQLTGENCGLAPCDEANHANLNWPLHTGEFAGAETLGFTFCIRPVLAAEGTPPATGTCTVAVDVVTTGNHDYEFNAPVNVRRCSAAAVISITGTWHIENRPSGANPIEIVH